MSDLMLKLYTRLQTLRAREEGQGMVEYGLLAALVSIVAIVALQGLGPDLNKIFEAVSTAVNGAVPTP
jgi:pilus assembly protein Flp/PilA